MRYEGTYYLAKPLRQMFERRMNGTEPCIFVDGSSDWHHFSSELRATNGEVARFQMTIREDKGKWHFHHSIVYGNRTMFYSEEAIKLTGTIEIRDGVNEYILHLKEFMEDYDDSAYAFLQETLHREDPEHFAYPDRQVMEEIVDMWTQGRYRKFVEANALYHDTFQQEAEYTKSGRHKENTLELWCKRHGVIEIYLRLYHEDMPTDEYRISDTLFDEDRYGGKDILKELYFGIAHDIYVYEKRLFLRTDKREALKLGTSKWHSKYHTYFGMDIEARNAVWMPFPLCIRDYEFVKKLDKQDSQITEADLISEEKMLLLCKCYEALHEKELEIQLALKNEKDLTILQ